MIPPSEVSHSNDDLTKDNFLVWTLQYASQFLSLSSINDKLKFIQNILNIQDDDYNYNPISTFLVDFHLGNAAFCVDSKFNAEQTFFVCKALSILLYDASSASSDQDLDYDNLRDQLGHKFQTLFKSSAPVFSVQEVKSILSFITSTFLRPIRMILLQFQNQYYYTEYIEVRKIFQPPISNPLSEFVENSNVTQYEFPIPYLSDDPKQLLANFEKYETEMKKISEKRLNELQLRIDELTSKLENDK